MKRLYDTTITFRLPGSAKKDIVDRARYEEISITHLLRSIITGYLK